MRDDLDGNVRDGVSVLSVFIIGLALVGVVWLGFIQLNLALDNAQVEAEQGSLRRERVFSQQITERWTSLEQTQGDIADLEAQLATFPQLYGEHASLWPQGKAEEYQQLQQQLANRRSAYRQQCASYEAMWLDQWRAELAPSGVPMKCPALQ